MKTRSLAHQSKNLGALVSTILRGAVVALAPAAIGAVTLGGEKLAYAGDIAAAEVLFNDGQKLFDAGKIHEACEKFQESYAQDPAIGTMINLARCHEKEGKTATAWGEYKTVETLASRSNQTQRQQYAHDEAAKLEPTLHQLVLSVKFPVDGLEITRNGTSVGKALWGEKIPVDPGEVVLKAVAPGKKPWTQTVRLAAGSGVDQFDIPKLEDAPVEAPPASKDSAGGGGGLGTGRILGLTLLGVGVATGATGGIFQGVALSEDSKASGLSAAKTANVNANPTVCGGTTNPSQLNQTVCKDTYNYFTHHNAAVSDQTIAIPLIAGGGALIIAGVVVFIFSGSSDGAKKTEKASFTFVPTFGPGQGGLSAVGRF